MDFPSNGLLRDDYSQRDVAFRWRGAANCGRFGSNGRDIGVLAAWLLQDNAAESANRTWKEALTRAERWPLRRLRHWRLIEWPSWIDLVCARPVFFPAASGVSSSPWLTRPGRIRVGAGRNEQSAIVAIVGTRVRVGVRSSARIMQILHIRRQETAARSDCQP